jgi:hypothetical protein
MLALSSKGGSSKSISPMSSLGFAVLQSGRRSRGVGLGAGVGGLAGAEGRVLPGMTLGFAGIAMGMDGPLFGEFMGRDRECVAAAFPLREA